jgi:hypothetical protein
MFFYQSCISLLFSFFAVISASSLAAIACGPHHLRVGPDVYYRDYDEKGLPHPAKSHEFGALYGLNLGYDYVKAHQFYFGSDINLSGGETVYDGSLVNYETLDIIPYESRTNNLFFDAEGRAGYTFEMNPRTTLSTFIGAGFHFWHRGAVPNNPFGYDEDYYWPYASLGLRADYCLTPQVSVGLNLKTMWMFSGKMIASTHPDDTFHLGSKLQYEAELPITYRLNCPKWFVDSVKITPYYRSRDIGKSDLVWVTLPSLDGKVVSFVEPESATHIVGIRLEFVHDF